MLKSRRTLPPLGFVFFQAETGWEAPKMQDFDTTLKAIIAHRAKNPRFNLATDWNTVADELDRYTCARLNNNPHYCLGQQEQSFSRGLASAQRPGPVQPVAGAAAKYVRNTTAGIGIYMEWFGEGKPVEKAEAERRASICVQCPKNVQGNIFQRFNAAIGKRLLQAFSILADLELQTSQDDRLGVCDPCDCPLRAKVWSPLDLIREHLPAESAANLWQNCWIR